MTPKKAAVPATQATEGAGAIALPAELAGIFDLKKNMEGILPRLPQIGIIHQGQIFKFPDDSKKAEFTGIVLHKNFCNAWWKESFDQSGGGTPPDCSSLDAITPDYNSSDLQAEKCAKCAQNKFGSGDKGKGKACKNMCRVHILLDKEATPYRLTPSPANLRALADYVSNVSLRGYPFQLVYTDFSLMAVQNKDGIEYSEIVMKMNGTITDPKIAMAIKQQMDQWMPAFLGQSLEAEEV